MAASPQLSSLPELEHVALTGRETLQASALDLSPLRTLAHRSLLAILDQIAEPKTLLLDANLAGPLGLVCDVGSLRAHGVERMFWLEEPKKIAGLKEEDKMKGLQKDVNAPTRAVVYVCKPSLSLMRVISASSGQSSAQISTQSLPSNSSSLHSSLKEDLNKAVYISTFDTEGGTLADPFFWLGHILYDRQTASNPNSLAHTYHALLSPRRSELALNLLTNLATPSLLSDLNLYDLGLELVPLEYDVLSLEEENSWTDIWARGDQGVIHRAAMALMTVQHIWGAFPRIVGKGDMAQRLSSLLLRQRREYLASDPTNPMLNTPSKVFDSIIIIDRSVDLATPLCTQLTYEGLVDEVVGIHSAHVEVDASLVSQGTGSLAPSGSSTPLTSTSKKSKKVRLDATSDPFFGSIRDENFAIVGEKLHTSAKKLNEDYEKRHNAKTVSEMKAFVSKLGGLTKAHTSLRLHTGLTEKIMEYTTKEVFNLNLELQQNIIAGLDLNGQLSSIEDLILAEAPLNITLRLLCLFSVVSGGIKPKNLEFLKREILQTYGYDKINLLHMLEKTQLLTRQTPSSSRSSVGFQAVRDSLRLVVDDVDEREPNDVSYVYSGYAPLSIRLIQAIAQKDALLARQSASSNRSKTLPKAHPIIGWRGFEDIVKCLPGASFDQMQTKTDNSNNEAPTHTFVFFLGGATLAEISALRFMSMQTKNRQFVVGTTNIISGDRLLQCV